MQSADHDKQQDEALAPFQTFDDKENNGASSLDPSLCDALLRDALGAARGARGARDVAQPQQDDELSDEDRAMRDKFRFFARDRVVKCSIDDVATPRVRATADGDQVVDVTASSAEALDGEARLEPAHKKARLGGGSGAVHASVAEEDDAEEEPDYRQKLRINATQRIAYLEKYGHRGNLLVTLDKNAGDDGPALALVSTTTALVTFLDAAGKEIHQNDVRRPIEPKLIGKGARRKLVAYLEGCAGAYEAIPLTESDLKATVIKWEKFDAKNVFDIDVKEAPVVDVTQEVFQKTGRGEPKERRELRRYLLDLRAYREKYHKDTLPPSKPTHHLYTGVDELYDAATNSHRFKQDEWRAGSGRGTVWEAVTQKIKEVNPPDGPQTNQLASAAVDREKHSPGRFQDEIFESVFSKRRSLDGLVGEETEEAPGSYVSLSAVFGFEGVFGYVHGETGRIYYAWRFYIPNYREVSSDVFFDTKEEARDARTRAIDNYDFPAGRPDAGQIEAIKRGYALAPDLYDLVCKKLAPDPREVPRLAPSQRYTTADNCLFWFHLTPINNLDSIMAHGLNCRALEDVLGSGKKHSRLPAAVWGSPNVEQCQRHGLSTHTIDRHVSNKMTTYATWNKVALIAIRMEGSGWHKITMPDYKQSGCTYQHVPAFDGREFDLAAEGNLAAMRAWAASL